MDKTNEEVQKVCVQVLGLLFQSHRIPGNKYATVTANELLETGYPLNLPTKIFRDHVSSDIHFKIRMLTQDQYSIVKVEEWMKSKKPINEQVEDKPLLIDMSKKKETLKQVYAKQGKKSKKETEKN